MLCYKAFIMPETGLEPVQDIIPGDFKSPVSTKFHHSGKDDMIGGVPDHVARP